MSRKKFKPEKIRISNKEMFLYGEDRKEWDVCDIEDWIRLHNGDQALADMCAKVWSHVGILHRNSEEIKCEQDIFDAWSALQDRLIEMVLDRMKGEVSELYESHYVIKNFMLCHGYSKRVYLWVPLNEDKRPVSVYVAIDGIEERKVGLLGLFSPCKLVAHTSDEEGYDFLEPGYTKYELFTQDDSNKLDIWLAMPEGYGEITFGVGEWHAHYDWYEHNLQCLEWEIEQIMSGKTTAMSLYAGEQWIGSTLLRDDPRNASYWDMLSQFHLSPEEKEAIKRESARLVFCSPVKEKCLEITYYGCW